MVHVKDKLHYEIQKFLKSFYDVKKQMMKYWIYVIKIGLDLLST